MKTLAQLPRQIPRREARVISLGGLNFSDDYADGQFEWTKGISARRFPYISTVVARRKMDGYEQCTALGSWDDLVAVKGTQLYYKGKSIGTVTAGEKQFAVINTKLVVWPDKKYIDMTQDTLVDMVASQSLSGVQFSGNTITKSGANFNSHFEKGNGITISGCTVKTANNRGKDNPLTIKSVTATTITFQTGINFESATESGTITIARPIPDLDFICESENRLWGCSNSEKTIFGSALGDPTTFYDYSGESTDSYAVAVGSKAEFTGCTKLGSSVLFWKEHTLHKLLGSYPEEYQLYTYEFDGVKAGCHKAMTLINETLIYVGTRGVYAYTGASPYLLSKDLGDVDFENARAGTDGKTYYLSTLHNGEYNFFTYDIEKRVWLREDDTQVIDFTTLGKDVYCLANDGFVYHVNTDDETYNGEWEIDFRAIFETVSGAYKSSTTLFEKKRYSKLVIRLDIPEGSRVLAEASFDNSKWKRCGEIRGQKENIVPLVIPINRCDKFQLRLKGVGECTILGMVRKYSEGSDR